MNNKITNLKSKLCSKKYILHGTLAKTYKQCGKVNCCCYDDKNSWHGPYWILTRKENGKTVTKTLNKSQVVVVKKAIKEMKEISEVIKKWEIISLLEIGKIS